MSSNSRPTTASSKLARLLRISSAIALFGIALDHWYAYYVDSYSSIPTIGTLFLLNILGGIALALAILAPIERIVPTRYARATLSWVALAGITLAAASLAALFVSESTPLFGFMEFGYRAVIVLAIVAESAAIVLLAAFLTVHLRRHSVRVRPVPLRSA
jgi:hypothetical protein